ncbi:MAG: hypothetical protein EBR09_08720 [Proteobacteria bacterium]|jgi:hypothetical protein|nr:hypothetical protein [Pseudomonadota bacterium]
MVGVTEIKVLSGWILPDASWQPAEEWWHVSALYDLLEKKPEYFTDALKDALSGGDEARIRRSASEAGFIKISRQQFDLLNISNAQLRTLQKLVEYIDPEDEFTVLLEHGMRQKVISVGRLLKLKSGLPITA